MQDQEIASLLEAVNAKVTTSEIWDVVSSFFANQGFDKLIYMNTKIGGPQVFSNLSDSWSEHYEDRRYHSIDPFLTHCCKTYVPVSTGADYVESYEYLTNPAQKLIQEAGEFGFRAGFSSMVRAGSAGQHIAGWNIGSSLGAPEVEKLRAERQGALRLAAAYAHERMERIDELQGFSGLPSPVRLSPRETECLHLLVGGARNKEIANRLGLSSAAIELYLRNARIKLGAKTREEAVARAIYLKLIDF